MQHRYGWLLAVVIAAGACDDRELTAGWWIETKPSSGNPMMPPGTGGRPVPPMGGSACEAPSPAPPVRAIGITGEELATRLALLLWADRPDASLALEAGFARSTADVAKLAQGMLNDARAQRGAAALAQRWLHSRDVAAIASQSPETEVRESMAREPELFLHDQIVNGGDLRSLLTGTISFVDGPLGATYGVMVPTPGFHRAQLPTNQRAGVLTQGAFLAARRSIPVRGLFVLDAFVCMQMPAPPDGLIEPPRAAGPGQTSREVHEMQVSRPECMGCHRIMDGVGLAFERYDSLARFRTLDNGKPIDASTRLEGVGDLSERRIDGALELGQALAGSCDVKRCVARQVVRYALRREIERGDEPSVDEVARVFLGRDLLLRELLVAAASTPAFLAP